MFSSYKKYAVWIGLFLLFCITGFAYFSKISIFREEKLLRVKEEFFKPLSPVLSTVTESLPGRLLVIGSGIARKPGRSWKISSIEAEPKKSIETLADKGAKPWFGGRLLWRSSAF
jgi:hypothetical protein